MLTPLPHILLNSRRRSRRVNKLKLTIPKMASAVATSLLNRANKCDDKNLSHLKLKIALIVLILRTHLSIKSSILFFRVSDGP
jgi:hypothetical protein